MWRYLKAAFWISPDIPGLGKVPVNVLALAGVAILGFVPLLHPVWLLGLGLETAFVFSLASHRRFRKWVDAQEARAARPPITPRPETVVQRILRELPDPLVQRFERLRAHCKELQKIAADLHDPDRAGLAPPLEDMQLAGLDRLLWIYLRLLFTQHMLDQFFQRADETQIRNDIRSLEERLRPLAGDPADRQKQKKRKALEDNLETCRERLANFQKAHEHGELVRLEIERLENKIRSLSELAVNRHEPNYIAGQVDQVVTGMVQTERTMSELQFATGLDVDEKVPQFLQREAVLAPK
jgi:hypothetical protein